MQYQRVAWACRRGMLELDLILEPFLEKHYLKLSEELQGKFQLLLAGEDQDLFAWLMRKSEPEDPELKEIVQIILDNKY